MERRQMATEMQTPKYTYSFFWIRSTNNVLYIYRHFITVDDDNSTQDYKHWHAPATLVLATLVLCMDNLKSIVKEGDCISDAVVIYCLNRT